MQQFYRIWPRSKTNIECWKLGRRPSHRDKFSETPSLQFSFSFLPIYCLMDGHVIVVVVVVLIARLDEWVMIISIPILYYRSVNFASAIKGGKNSAGKQFCFYFWCSLSVDDVCLWNRLGFALCKTGYRLFAMTRDFGRMSSR